jgi:hypothetical protein
LKSQLPKNRVVVAAPADDEEQRDDDDDDDGATTITTNSLRFSQGMDRLRPAIMAVLMVSGRCYRRMDIYIFVKSRRRFFVVAMEKKWVHSECFLQQREREIFVMKK